MYESMPHQNPNKNVLRILLFLDIFLLIHLNLFRLQRLRLLFSYYHRLYFITGWFVNESLPLLYSMNAKKGLPLFIYIHVFSSSDRRYH